MKQCSNCKEFKIEREFNKDRTNPDGLDYKCKSCNSNEAKQLWKSDKGKQSQRLRSRKYELKRLYGITLDDYNNLLKKQNYGCAICGSQMKSKLGNLHVDHDHKTGIVRGLLCIQCNITLGMLREDSNRIKKVLQYLEYNTSKNTQLETIQIS